MAVLFSALVESKTANIDGKFVSWMCTNYLVRNCTRFAPAVCSLSLLDWPFGRLAVAADSFEHATIP
jgi:hypothetical protein